MVNLDLWGGVECTVNRVGDQFFDQIQRNGHWSRVSDLDLFASLKIKKLRYPVLWEHVSPENPAEQNWSWPDERLRRLRELGIDPIVGLVHHGSGPRYTHLLDPGFAQGLARHARAVAERYPWVEHYTPVNEPLTTARFSGLYGHWYPHAKDGAAFVRMLFHQIEATKRSMQAIREVNPAAKLVQTEDLGKTHSSPPLQYQADFENERRWLSFDLLCGRVDRHHPLWPYFRWLGLTESEILAFTENPLPPDVLGVNHYITSERFLDHQIFHYPASSHGFNGKDRYADVEAVRVEGVTMVGVRQLLLETWQRYGLPIAVTEAHISCTHEEQLRWFKEVWDAASSLREGQEADIRAVTAWSLLGAYDWNSLLTKDDGYYESGVFDLRGPSPRLTALARMLPVLAEGQEYRHPLLDTAGWWHRPGRHAYRCLPDSQIAESRPALAPRPSGQTRPLLVTGATGTLGRAFETICRQRGIFCRLTSREEMDIADIRSVQEAIRVHNPWGVINAAGYLRVDEAESDAERCYRENTDGPETLAKATAEAGIRLLTFSSDLVFDGEKDSHYLESDVPNPLNVYGSSKALAEQKVLALWSEALVIRTSAFFGPWDHYNFVHHVLSNLKNNQPFAAPDDLRISPTYVPDLVHASLNLLLDGEKGIWHLANQGSYSWAEFAAQAATMAQADANLIEARPAASFNWPANRPAFTALGSERGFLMPSVEHALHRYLHEAAGLLLHVPQKRKSMVTVAAGVGRGGK
jgi:dTDP-4-dehydrorhamnose reductase